ncbi:hypothetical protein UPYG_G00296300 [Umbra pygmaea]|uniref:PWWP domain-containing protein n=1 Tax=Umbra pygmaea TaxID=75934 RepID=A0ABD0WV64_UMBPY
MNSAEDHQAPTPLQRVSPLSSPHRSGNGDGSLPIRQSQTTNSANTASLSETPSTNPASPSETPSTNPASPSETPASTDLSLPSETPSTNISRPSETPSSTNPASPSETPSTNPASPAETPSSTNISHPSETPASTNPASPSETPASTNPAIPSETPASTNPASPAETPSTNISRPSETPSSTNPASPSETPSSTNPASPAQSPASTNPASPSETPASTNPASPAETPSTNISRPSETPSSTNPASPSETPSSTNPAIPSETPSTNISRPAETSSSTNLCNPSETPISNNPSSPFQTINSNNPIVLPKTPPTVRTAREGIAVSQSKCEQCKRERSPQHKTPQTPPEHQPRCPSDMHPCVQRDTEMEAATVTQPLSPNSPVPEDICQTPDMQTGARTQGQVTNSPESGCQGPKARPEASSEPSSPSKDLQMCCEVENSSNFSKDSVGQGDRVELLAGTIDRLTDSQATGATELGGETRQNSSLTGTGKSLGKRVKEQRPLNQSSLNRMDLRRRPNETKTYQDNKPQCTDQKGEIVRIEIKTAVKSSTHKVDMSNENLRKRKYPSQCKTPEVEQSQEESVAKRKKVSKISTTSKVKKSQESVIKKKKVSKLSPIKKVAKSMDSVSKMKKVSKIPGTHKVSQETVTKSKSTNKSPLDKTDQSHKTVKNGKKATKSKTNKMEQVASTQSQSRMVAHSLGVAQSQTVKKRKCTEKSQSLKLDSQDTVVNVKRASKKSQNCTANQSQETVRNGEKASRKSQKDKLESLATDESQEKSVQICKYSRKPQNRREVSALSSCLPVLSPDRSSSLSSGTLNSPGVPKRKYTKKSQTKTLALDIPSSGPAFSPVLQGNICLLSSPAGMPLSPITPKRTRALPTRQQHSLCSTPDVHPRPPTGSDDPSVSLSPLGLNVSPISHLKPLKPSRRKKTAQLDVGLLDRKCRGRTRVRNTATEKNQYGTETKAATEEGSQSCTSKEKLQAKRVRRSRRGQTEGCSLPSDNTASADLHRCRPRFEMLDSDFLEKDSGDASMSSDLSIELSLWEDNVTSQTFEADEEEEQDDEEELPSFLNNTKPLPITEGICVWCKFRNYPYWPAMVKSVNRKLKKASIVFIDNLLLDEKRIRKGITVALKTLKPFDCEEADQLVCKAKEKYDAAIKWCLELIADYRIRIGCGFTGSFIEYFSDNISCPVRRRYPQGSSELTFPSKQILEEERVTSDPERDEAEEHDQQERRRKLLPDRSKAARNRANEKLVDFIVRQRRVETRLLGVISGQQQSRWLRRFLAASRSVIDTYLEDEEQLDQVIKYLSAVLETAPSSAPCLADVDCIRLVLDVLLPEAVIYAIAGVEELSLVEAEKKYLQGPPLSKRERQEFDEMIEQQLKMKALNTQRAVHGT